MCSNRACITHQFVCDGDDDCGDNSDEEVNCCKYFLPHETVLSQYTLTVLLPCEGASIRCNTTGTCLPFWKGCNGVDDCSDRTDETNCNTGCLNIVRLNHPNHTY